MAATLLKAAEAQKGGVMNGTYAESSQFTAVVPWWVVLVQGIALLTIGALLVFNTAVTTVVLVVFIGWWWLISGLFELGSLFVDRTAWGWRLLSGILSIAAGAYIIGAPLVGTAIVIGFATILIGIDGMIIGVTQIAHAVRGAGWGRGVLGVLSLLFGAVIAFNWTTFAVALPWLWGVLAMLSGAVAIAGSFAVKRLLAEA